MKKIAITTGDPAGIGPEIVAKSIKYRKPEKDLIFIIYGENYKNSLNVKKIKSVKEATSSNKIYHIEIGEKIEKGKPSKLSGQIAYNILNTVSEDLKADRLDAVITAPISKTHIQIIEPEFIGHTEFFAKNAELSNDDVIMSFWSNTFNLMLLTTHLSIKDAIDKLSYQFIYIKLKKIIFEIRKIDKNPNIAILGVNPHAGENGKFGQTDEIMKQVIKRLNKENLKIDGPFPADSFFASSLLKYKYVVSALHDVGLVAFKLLNFNEGVNVTLGLPYVRTSPDHGTAFDIADKEIANEISMQKAIDFAIRLLHKKEKTDIPYSTFAKYYDKYMEHVDYDRWTDFILEKYNLFNYSSPDLIFELACGTANISSRLVEKGFKVYASDNSEEMLKIADKKQNKPILINHNFLNPLPIRNLNLILLIFDSLNYISDKNNIEKLFENVYQALSYNGIFIFDISTVKNCKDNFDGFVNLEDEESIYFIHESTYNDNKLISHLTFFEKQGYRFKRDDERHIQYIYKVKTIVDLIKKSNLQLKGYFALERPNTNLLKTPLFYDEIDNDYDRIFFVVKKEI